MNTKNEITLIICTKDRPKDIANLLDSIRIQSRKPKLIIIVDGSDLPIKDVLIGYEDLNIDYVQVRPPSLPKQRNVGISRLPEWSDWVGFLDDDLVLSKDALEQIIFCSENFKASKPIGGIGMIIKNCTYPKFSIWRAIFLLDSKRGGEISPSACPTMIRNIEKDNESSWLSGGVSFWKKEVFSKYSFDEWFDGIGYLEDIDFSYRVSREYSLIYCSKATCDHFHHPVPVKKFKTLGSWQITSWWYFSQKNGHFKKIAVLWSMLGLSLNNMIMGVVNLKSYRLLKFNGNLIGFYKIFTGKALNRTSWHK